MREYIFQSPKTLVVGSGASARIGELAAQMQASSVLLVSDHGVHHAGLLDSPIRHLRDQGVAVELFLEVEADPSTATVQAATAKAVKCRADCIIAVGGGSPMDVAKLVAALARSDVGLDEIY